MGIKETGRGRSKPLGEELRFPQARNIVEVRSTRRETDSLLAKIDAVLEPRPQAAEGLGAFVSYFDRKWRQEALPHDWYNLHGKKSEVGFSMRMQLDLLKDANNPQEMTEWTQKTKQDLIGFKLEYLSNHLVYPYKYERSATEPTRLESREYGRRDISETVSEQERNGSVKAAVREVKAFFLSDETPDGSIAVLPSPKGDSGLRTDKGEKIEYPDSHFFIMQKNGDTITNYTIKTDFSVRESREVIYQLIGRRLPVTASLEDYVRAVATIKPDQEGTVHSVTDVVRVLQAVRPSHAYKDEQIQRRIEWNAVYRDIAQAEKLYNFNEKTQQVITDFENYCPQGEHTKDSLQKAIAATILRMSELFYAEEEKSVRQIRLEPIKWSAPFAVPQRSFGNILDAVAERPGCAGGGSSKQAIAVGSVNPRLGIVGGSQEWFNCPKCEYKADGPIGDICPGCGITKEEYALEVDVVCD